MKWRASGWGHKVDHPAIGARSPGFKSYCFPQSTSDWGLSPGLWRPQGLSWKDIYSNYLSLSSLLVLCEITSSHAFWSKFWNTNEKVSFPEVYHGSKSKIVFKYQMHPFVSFPNSLIPPPHCLWCCGSNGKLAVAEMEGTSRSQGKMPRCHTGHSTVPPGSHNYLSYQILSLPIFQLIFNLFFFDFLRSHRRFRSMLYLLQGGHQLRSRPRNWRGRRRHKVPSAPYLFPQQERTAFLMENITLTSNQAQSESLVKISDGNAIGF